ncbi:hypothetical protein BH11BAC3_BH11BAC3_11670 [soil metagenome]
MQKKNERINLSVKITNTQFALNRFTKLRFFNSISYELSQLYFVDFS